MIASEAMDLPNLRQNRAIGTVGATALAALMLSYVPVSGAEPLAVALPPGVQAVWDIEKAYHDTTPTRERICLNGLWQWQPAVPEAKEIPGANWGYFKVPGCWPGITDYLQKDCQTVYSHPSWRAQRLAGLKAAWYQREFAVPSSWAGRRVFLSLEYLNSYAAVFVDGHQVGETQFPGGEVEISGSGAAAGGHRLSLLVVALPLRGVMLSYTDSAAAREQKGSVERRGLCGDVYLTSTPPGPRLTDLRVETSVRKQEFTVQTTLDNLAPGGDYHLRAQVLDGGTPVKEFTSGAFRAADLKQGSFAFSQSWLANKLWDINSPTNQYELKVTLCDAAGNALDQFWTTRFGFRELWIDGRDFILNGTRVFLSAVPLDNAQVDAELASYAGARESLERLKSFGINFVYTHNYGCQPGAHLGFEEVLRAADDVGMLVSFSQPHFSHYDWKAGDADQANGYARHAAYYVRAAQNHPSVVMYSMSHNATGYDEDMNPDMIDGVHDARDSWALKNVKLALRAEAIVHRLDSSRIIYHHASGNLSSMHAINFYPNFVPIQELSDWFGHWAADGVKPVFLCEYGAPFTWDWTMYRGWYQGHREFGSAAVPWEFCLAEWNAQFLGDQAFAISDAEKRNLRWEAQQFRQGKLWHRWDYPVDVGSTRLTERYPVFARYLTDNWRAFRTWQVSAISPWEFEHFWTLRPGVDRRRRELKTDWQHLQQPGFSPDYEDQRYERMDLAYQRSDWVPTIAAEALLRNNQPLLAYLAGKPGAFTSKDHNFLPGETVQKQLIVINNSREPVAGDWEWKFDGPGAAQGSGRFSLPTGQQQRVPIDFALPGSASPGRFQLIASVRFKSGAVQEDRFALDLMPPPEKLPRLSARLALFDPKGDTGRLLAGLGCQTEAVQADTDLSRFEVLVVGKGALSVDGPAPDLGRVREGLKVLVFEQTSAALEKRLGFRVEEYGLREVFPRIPDHPALTGLGPGELRNWRGDSTLTPPRLSYQLRPQYGPTVQWCGITEPHLWRCGNRGNVASVLIEKPTSGDFLPIVDGGFSLQFSPLLEYREGRGTVLFCQLDVTGRTGPEPAAERIVRNLVEYISTWRPPRRRTAVYAGDPAGERHLQSVGIPAVPYSPEALTDDHVLVLGPDSGQAVMADVPSISRWLNRGGKLLAIGLPDRELNRLLPVKVSTRSLEHISGSFSPFGLSSIFAGIGPADLHNRDPRQFPLVTSGAQISGDGVLAQVLNGSAVFCQMTPWEFNDTQPNLKRTHRRISFAVSRLLANLGVASTTPLLERFHQPVSTLALKNRCLSGLYLDTPEEWDDPYRHFRW